MIPPCANWSLWVGEECEGTIGLKERTIFIRNLPENSAILTDLTKLTNNGKIRRVWFCAEFKNWSLLRKIAARFSEVCVEVRAKEYHNTPPDILQNYRIYLKVNLALKEGDHICIGPPFRDESFAIGSGAKVKPDMYLKDIMVLP